MIKTNGIIINTGVVFISSDALRFFGTTFTEHRVSRSVKSLAVFIGNNAWVHQLCPIFLSGGKTLYFVLYAQHYVNTAMLLLDLSPQCCTWSLPSVSAPLGRAYMPKAPQKDVGQGNLSSRHVLCVFDAASVSNEYFFEKLLYAFPTFFLPAGTPDRLTRKGFEPGFSLRLHFLRMIESQ